MIQQCFAKEICYKSFGAFGNDIAYYLQIGLSTFTCILCRYDYSGYGQSTGKVVYLFLSFSSL